jgi:hypothetical protein
MEVVVAVLAKDKEHVLPTFLDCLLKQDYPKKFIHLYIRTNDNNDSTATLLKDFIDVHGGSYASVHYDDADIDSTLKKFGQHEWNRTRFKILGAIRQESVAYAKKLGADYFVIDCDNLIAPFTLTNMVMLRHLGVVAPMLDDSKGGYSNYHYTVDGRGYFLNSELYNAVRTRAVKGFINVAVVHCTYYIEWAKLDDVCYDDGSGRYEYVIFSDCLRKKGIAQYLDNRRPYGFISFAEGKEDFMRDLEMAKKYFS